MTRSIRMRRQRGNAIAWVAFALSLLALGAGVTALCFVLFSSDPLGRGLSDYNFSTPKDAILSTLRIELNQDLRAQLELEKLSPRRKLLEEQVKTMNIKSDADFEDKRINYKVVLASYKADGAEQHEVYWLQKDESGRWIRATRYISSDDVRDSNKRLADEIDAWRANK